MVHIFDTAGTYEYNYLTVDHYRMFLGFIFVVDETKESMEYFQEQIRFLQQIGTKIIGWVILNRIIDEEIIAKVNVAIEKF